MAVDPLMNVVGRQYPVGTTFLVMERTDEAPNGYKDDVYGNLKVKCCKPGGQGYISVWSSLRYLIAEDRIRLESLGPVPSE